MNPQMSTEQLFGQWQIAEAREKKWNAEVTANPANEVAANWFSFYNMKRQLIYREIEHRAERMDSGVLLFLIESCGIFSFNPSKTNQP